MSPKAIIDRVGDALSRQTFKNYLDAYRKGWLKDGLPFPAGRFGRPPEQCDDTKEKAVTSLKADNSTRKVAGQFGVSQSSVVCMAVELDVVARIAVYRPILSIVAREKRVEFAKAYINKTDEWFKKGSLDR